MLQPGSQYAYPGSAQYPPPQQPHGGLPLGHQPTIPQPQPSHQGITCCKIQSIIGYIQHWWHATLNFQGQQTWNPS